ncbi:MAG: helix-turn-helix domain-containing protein [Methanomicrobiales archaeon]|nr:helix-turn-helix domain-containing protein [Methanomicrobiales archaeon]
MSEEPEKPTSQKFRLLSPDDEETRLIGKAIASETAGKILGLLAGREVTAMELSEELELPVSTVMYHLENLIFAGLIEISRTRYSVKGREMKVYRLVDQVLIMSPGKVDMKSVLARCGVLFSIPLAVAAILAYIGFSPASYHTLSPASNLAKGAKEQIVDLEMDSISYSAPRAMESLPIPEPSSPASTLVHDIIPGTASFLDVAAGIIIGALLVIIAWLLIEYYHQKR